MTRALLLIILVAACGNSAAPPAATGSAGSAAVASTPVPTTRVAGLVDRLRSKDAGIRKKALDELRDNQLGGDEGLELLRASTLDFGDDSGNPSSVSSLIVQAVKPEPAVTALVEQLMPAWRAGAKAAGMDLLSRIGDDESTRAFVRLLPAVATTAPHLVLEGVRNHPHHGDLVVPALLALDGNDELHDEVYRTLVAYCVENQLTAGQIGDKAPALLATYRHVIADVTSRQRGSQWLHDKAYAAVRERASLLLDLFRCVPGDDIAKELTAVLANRDPRLVFFGVKSLRALGRPIPDTALARVAADPENRNWLIYDLAKTHELARIPARYRTQAAIAEAAMVEWFAFPDELGHAPEALALAKVVTAETDAGVVDVYVFKIKTDDGWVAGVAGPYLRKDEPTTISQGGTFSRYEPWPSATPEQHAAQLSPVIADAEAARKRTR